MKYLKSILYGTVLSVGFFWSPFESKADCTLTTSPGTNGRCFTSNGQYVCLERAEDTQCFAGPIGEQDT